MNPVSLGSCYACGRAQGAVDAPSHGADTLLDEGLARLEAGDEDSAFQRFVAATEVSPDSEAAWRWRARTAPTLDEFIFCLGHVLRLNPADGEVQKALNEALQRNGRGNSGVEAAVVAPGVAAEPALAGETSLDELVDATIRSWLLQVAGILAFASAVGLVVPALIRLGGMDARPEFGALLTLFPRSRVMLSDLVPAASYLPTLDLGGVLSLVLGLLLLPGAFKIVNGGGVGVQVRLAGLLAAVSILMLFFGANPPLSSLAAVTSAIGVAAALAGKAPPAEVTRDDGWVHG